MVHSTGREIFQRGLEALYGMDAVVDNYALTYANLSHCGDMGEAETYLLASIERYIHAMRLQLVELHGPFPVVDLEVSVQKMMQLNRIVGARKVPRTFIWLYLHAHLHALATGHAEWLERFEKVVADSHPA